MLSQQDSRGICIYLGKNREQGLDGGQGLIAQFSKCDFWNLGDFLNQNMWSKFFSSIFFSSKIFQNFDFQKFSIDFFSANIFFWKIFFDRKFVRSKNVRRKKFRPHIPIQKIPKIPKIILIKLCDEAWCPKTKYIIPKPRIYTVINCPLFVDSVLIEKINAYMTANLRVKICQPKG